MKRSLRDRGGAGRYAAFRFMPAAYFASPRAQGSLDADGDPTDGPESAREQRGQQMPGMIDLVLYKHPPAFAAGTVSLEVFLLFVFYFQNQYSRAHCAGFGPICLQSVFLRAQISNPYGHRT